MNGQEVVIGKAGKPVAKLVPYQMDTRPRVLGTGKWQEKIWIVDNFEELPEEMLKLFTGEVEEHESFA